ncbi:phosphatidylinositol 3-kinase catalytic subunit type 3-like [Homarus americanus]|uniref:phosphatidylinositol 3-kinase catalytic subunit type 3-like n=1 Tax=Homarus americanus TaxID=6706 RepID=UPI001C43BB29|nr:phosphatidylinositol 3-kinase catalytic subunit type 3-like [Homarus americanus]
MEPDSDKFWYVHSCDLDVDIQVKIGTLDGKREKPNYEALLKNPLLKYSGLYQPGCSDLYVSCQVFSDGRELTLPVRTSYKPFSARWNWNEWLTLPLRFSDLPRNAVLALTIYDTYGPRRNEPIGGTTISFFGKHGVFRQGLHDLRVWPNRIADHIHTPGKGQDHGKDQMQRLAKLAKKHRNGQMMKVDWLDRLTFREIELINEQEKRSSNSMYLMVEFPRVEHEGVIYSIVWWERGGSVEYDHRTSGNMVRMPDPEIALENLQEAKHHRLARSLRSGVTDRDLKPNSAIRDSLHTIMEYPPTKQLSSDEQDMVWKYRFYLSTQKKALTKFLKCVNWKLTGEAKQAIELLGRWVPPDADDALELLGPGFTHPDVRRYAVERLSLATDEDLLLYLLQLVQALKYEALDNVDMSLCDVSHYSSASDTSGDTCHTEERTPEDSIQEKMCESSGSTGGDLTQSTSSSLEESEAATIQRSPSSSLLAEPDSSDPSATAPDSGLLPELADMDTDLDLASFLIQRAARNPTLANYLYWYLLVECEDQDAGLKHDAKVREMYVWVLRRFKLALQQGCREARSSRLLLTRQHHFLDQLVALVKAVARESGNRMRKIEKLQTMLADSENLKINFASFEPLALPLDPEVIVTGIVPERASLFKSALEPSRLTFNTISGGEYVAIFKHGDDLRQDQLIIQIITLMDRLLRRENLDLRLTPYKVLATSSKHGFVQFIESHAVADVLRTEGGIQNFFRKYAPSETAAYGIAPEVMDTYIKSCAGYCVITYLLGIGDRHLDNLLLTRNGNLFHIDFGYILGRDPKPLPPPMKLSKEMVEGMGGAQSEHYHEFRKLCYTAFHQLRRHANLILNLFSLMVDANVPDIALEPDKTVKKVEDKFRLDLSDEEAVSYMQGLIDDSVNAVVAVVVEQLHKFAQYIRK